MPKYLVTGGRQQEGAQAHVDFFCYEEARILSFDDEGRVEPCASYRTPAELRPEDPRANVVFKAGSLVGDRFYVCTQTEILVYALPGFEIVEHISHPWLNDVHHVLPRKNGNLLIANTGLDQALELSPDGDFVREWNTCPDQATWDRFDPETDYRRVVTTKPHHSHPNYMLEHDGEIWVTRFKQRDLQCLTDPTRRLDVGIQSVHDGVIHSDTVFLTTVDGHVVEGDLSSGSIIAVHDLNAMTETDKTLGWCRGIHILDDRRVLVGFSRLRPSKVRENLRWVKFKLGLRNDGGRLPTRVACYDLKAKRLEWEVDLEAEGLNAVFCIHPLG